MSLQSLCLKFSTEKSWKLGRARASDGMQTPIVEPHRGKRPRFPAEVAGCAILSFSGIKFK